MENQRRIKKDKLIFFWSITLVPLLLLIFFIGYIGLKAFQINTIDYEKVQVALEEYLAEKEGIIKPLTPIRNTDSLNLHHIFTFGASSVVVSDSNTFSQYLEAQLNKKTEHIKITNFGIPGLDSYSIKLRVQQVLDSSKATPELALLYLGHNDFNNAYDRILKKAFPSLDLILKPMYYFSDKQEDRIIAPMKYDYYARLKKPEIINSLQELGLAHVQDPIHKLHDEQILKYFKKNLAEMLRSFIQKNIPVLIITPIGNVQAKPFGNKHTVTENYAKGLQLGDYKLLKTAQNNELLTYDIRAKSTLNEYLVSLEEDQIHVLNLEGILLEEDFAFGNNEFLDYFHMNAKSHRAIANKIQQKLEKIGFDFALKDSSSYNIQIDSK